MNTTATAQIASFLKIEDSVITRCEEWASVWFIVIAKKGARFVSKKVVKMTQPKTLTGYWFPGMPVFTDIEDEIEWLDNNRPEEPSDSDAIGEIAKYLPSGHMISSSFLIDAARRVIDGHSTPKEEAQRLSSKKILIKRGN
jgi:hypothetical protein